MYKVPTLIIIILIFLCGLIGYFLAESLKIRQTLVNIGKEKEEEFSLRLKKEKELIREDMEFRFRPDIRSFEETAKSLELERNKVKDLEAKLKEQTKENQKPAKSGKKQ